MANNNWAPQAVAVKEKITVTVGGTLAGEDFKLGLGDPVGADEVQTCTTTGAGSGGTFILTVPLPNGNEMDTAAIAWDANAAAIETAIDTAFALQSPAPPAGSIKVAGTDMDADDIVCTFSGVVYKNKDWPLITSTLATGWSAALFAETTKGLPITGFWIAEHTDADTDPATTVAALVAAWNASTHPWAAAVAAVAASPNLTLEAKVAGVPFGDFLTDTDQTWEVRVRGYYEIALNTPGGAATLTQDETTANQGANCANLAANWSNGTYLQTGDEVTITNSGIDILWGLDHGSDNPVMLNSLDIRKSMAGKIGLDSATFGGLTTAPEYRGHYFRVMVDDDEGDVTIGAHNGLSSVLGSRRIKLDLKGHACRVEMQGSNSQPFETGKPAVRILTDDVTTVIHVRGAPGGFGIAMDQPGETSEAGQLAINCASTKDRIYTGPGLHLAHPSAPFVQHGGYCRLQHVPSDAGNDKLDAVQFDDGVLETEGDFHIDELTQDGGVFYPNHWNSDGEAGSLNEAIEIAAYNKGVCDTTRSMRARKWENVTQVLQDHTLLLNGTAITMTSFSVTAPGWAPGV